MIVQELFRAADSEMVFHAYTLIRPMFDDLDNHTMREKADILKHLRKYIEKVCKQIANSNVDDTDKRTVFVTGRTRTDWGKSYIQDLVAFTIKDSEAAKSVYRNFTLWTDDGDVRLKHYGLGFVSIPVVAGYKIAKASVNEQGAETCCAAILRDMFAWGFTDEQRERCRLDLEVELDKAEEDILHNGTISHDELMEMLFKDSLKNATDDEKEHFRLEREYRKKVKEIEKRYVIKIMEKDHKRFIDMVREEYSKQ